MVNIEELETALNTELDELNGLVNKKRKVVAKDILSMIQQGREVKRGSNSAIRRELSLTERVLYYEKWQRPSRLSKFIEQNVDDPDILVISYRPDTDEGWSVASGQDKEDINDWLSSKESILDTVESALVVLRDRLINGVHKLYKKFGQVSQASTIYKSKFFGQKADVEHVVRNIYDIMRHDPGTIIIHLRHIEIYSSSGRGVRLELRQKEVNEQTGRTVGFETFTESLLLIQGKLKLDETREVRTNANS